MDISIETAQNRQIALNSTDLELKHTSNSSPPNSAESHSPTLQKENTSTLLQKTTSFLAPSKKTRAFFNLFKGFIGSGILALPYAFQQSGIVLGMIVFLIISLLMQVTMELLLEVADKIGNNSISYEQLAQIVFGNKGMQIVQFFLIMFQFGSCIGYLVFFLKFFHHVFQPEQLYQDILHDLIYLSIALLIIIPMNLINDMDSFAKFSLIGNFFILSCLLAITVNSVIQFIQSNSYNEQRSSQQQNSSSLSSYTLDQVPLFEVSNLLRMLGISVFSFECIGIVFSIRQGVQDSVMFSKIFTTTSISITVLYLGFAILGAISEEQKHDIILFLLPKRIDTYYFQITYAIALAISYPIQLLPALHILENGQVLKTILKPNSQFYLMKRFGFRVVISFMISGVALVIPEFALFINFIGAFAGVSLQLIFPVLMHLVLFKETLTKAEIIRNYFCLIMGFLGGIAATIMSIIDLVQAIK